MARTAWFHCFAGTAGDMTLGALVHAGADPLVVADLVGRLPIDGYALSFEAVQRCGIAATHAVVVSGGAPEPPAADADASHEDHDHHHHDHEHDHEHDHQHEHDHHDHDHDPHPAHPHRP